LAGKSSASLQICGRLFADHPFSIEVGEGRLLANQDQGEQTCPSKAGSWRALALAKQR